MPLLAAANYDPAAAVNKVCTSRLAMTAIDQTNLRVTFTGPANGSVMVRLKGTVHGATTFPRIHLGVIENSPSSGTLRGRASPTGSWPTALATTQLAQEASYLVTGLNPGTSYTWDAAYGVDILLASTGLKYGGPNDASGNDAWGAFQFEIWSVPHLIAGVFYDPTTSATEATTSLLAMTAMDTTNLRLTFTAPANGNVFWRIHAQVHGSTTYGSTHLGILESATVVARASPMMCLPETSVATTCVPLEASGVITGVSAGSHNYDAAYAVQVVAGAGGIKYGGPNDTTTDNCYGGIAFELWQG